MNNLASKKCGPCQTGQPPMNQEQINVYMTLLGSNWHLNSSNHLESIFVFSNFKKALDFTVRIGQLAEEQGHHPDILVSWGKVVVTLFTHKIKGLSENDFILAAKIDQLPK